MKKFISLVLGLAMALSLMPSAFAAYTDVADYADYYMPALRLQDLGIISGYSDGSFRPGNTITRAEFTKIVVCMMDKETEARASMSTSGFFDVPQGSWSAPYINYAVQKEILSGYSDGSFGPDRTISYAEAVTILLRTLGYQESEVGYFWPSNYVNAAASLGMSAGLSYAPETPLTRAAAAILTDRALFTKPSAVSYANCDTYLETLGYSVLDDALVLDRDKTSDNVTVLAGNLKINSAQTYIAKTQLSTETGEMYKYAVVDKDGYLAAVLPYDGTEKNSKEEAVVNRVSGNTIEYTTVDGRKGSYRADDSFIVYYDNSRMTFSTAKNNIENGADIAFYGQSYGAWNIAVVGNMGDVDPVLASHNYTNSDTLLEGATINKTNLTVYRDGKAATLSDIKANDAVYYNTKTNTMDVYSKKITGIYYDAIPSKAYVESVTVGGKTYNIGYSAATNRLNASSGAFDIGDKVTLILGKNDEVVFATDNSGTIDYFEYGVVISSYQRTATSGENIGSTEFVTEMFMTDGEIHEIVTDKLYKDNSGDFMKINYSSKTASLIQLGLSDASSYAGEIDIDKRTIGKKYVLKDAAIIQRVSDDDAVTAECELLDFDKLTSKSIDQYQIINAVTANAFGDIAILYVKNLESTYKYGVITGFIKDNEGETNGYKIFADGVSGQYQLSGAGRINTSIGAGVGFRVQNGGLTKIVSLSKLDSAGDIKAVEGSRIMLGSNIYEMAAQVEIVDITSNTNTRSLSIDELADLSNISSVTLYSDKSASNGGIVRLITVKTK